MSIASATAASIGATAASVSGAEITVVVEHATPMVALIDPNKRRTMARLERALIDGTRSAKECPYCLSLTPRTLFRHQIAVRHGDIDGA